MNDLVLVPVRSNDMRWRLAATWTGYGVTIPQNFDTDLASFPRLLEVIIHRNSWCWIIPGVIHDWRYRTGVETRSFADAEMRDIALKEGAPKLYAWVVWCGLRVGGWRAWRNYRK